MFKQLRRITVLTFLTFCFCSPATAIDKRTLNKKDHRVKTAIHKIKVNEGRKIEKNRAKLRRLYGKLGHRLSRVDFNADTAVDQRDLDFFKSCYGTQAEQLPTLSTRNVRRPNRFMALGCNLADLNRDGAVNLSDLAMFASLYQEHNPDVDVIGELHQ